MQSTKKRDEIMKIASLQNRLSLNIAFIVCLLYFSFIAIVGLNPKFLGTKIASNGLTIGILWGVGLIVISIFLSYLFIKLNKKYSDKIEELVGGDK